jgi:hypothetical protein
MKKYVLIALLFTGCAMFQRKEEEPVVVVKEHKKTEREDFVTVAYTKIEALINDNTSNKGNRVLFSKAKPSSKNVKQVSYEIKRMIRSRAVSISFKIEEDMYVAQVVTELFDSGSDTDVTSIETIVIKLSDKEEFLAKLKVALRRAL